MKFYYNPLDLNCKSVTGAVAVDAAVDITVFCDEVDACLLVFSKDRGEVFKIEMQKISGGFTYRLDLSEAGLYFYHFHIPQWDINFGVGNYRLATEQKFPIGYQLTVYKKQYDYPQWFNGKIMYQIFPDRFCRCDNPFFAEGAPRQLKCGSFGRVRVLRDDWGGLPNYSPDENGKILNNDFFGGNIKGIISKLDYLKSLNVGVIYLNPINKSFSNHRYDTADYMKIDELFGTDEDFDLLIKKSDELGIKIVIDGVYNHTGDDSVYFNKYGTFDELGAYQSKESKYYGWYKFIKFPSVYESWWGIDTLPAVNEFSEAYNDFINGKDGVVEHWLKKGVAGLRLDVVDELPSPFVKKLTETAKKINPNALIIGEVWEDASNKISYGERREYLQGGELDSVMNYPLKNAIVDFVLTSNSSAFVNTLFMLTDNYPQSVLNCLMNVLSTHDTSRILTVLSQEYAVDKNDMSKKQINAEALPDVINRLKIAALIQFTVFGVPCIYYGDEAGMQGYNDPFCRRPFKWDDINGEINEYYKRLGEIRKIDLFSAGKLNVLFYDDNCVVYERRLDDRSIIVYINRGFNIYNIKYDGVLYELLSGSKFENIIEVNPKSYGIIYNNCI